MVGAFPKWSKCRWKIVLQYHVKFVQCKEDWEFFGKPFDLTLILIMLVNFENWFELLIQKFNTCTPIVMTCIKVYQLASVFVPKSNYEHSIMGLY